ncbi:hypothetical protein Avi_8010 (plasmid) [Allorhizobium ampelinum S4]|uniref:Uncharacterized protein n=3 Tax=Rhizobiaceae TaxID=82115 RepID=B9K4A0_ALLAM|nr:hypothetical protein Avi_8010 [Allorhizobium ampelinum S4]
MSSETDAVQRGGRGRHATRACCGAELSEPCRRFDTKSISSADQTSAASLLMQANHTNLQNMYANKADGQPSIDSPHPIDQRCPMSQTSDFIAKLVRGANQLDRLDAYQKRRLLERAVTTIREMRAAIGMPNGPGRDVVLDLHTTALSIEQGWRTDDQVRNAFLTAAGMLRDLHIVLDSKTSIRIVVPLTT